ncbi:arsenate reductase/protein-tyrosine-phosphatase family protein [Yaniella halotolerans]|uniref:arsenate reductase/protein-tyrosine-phosphatase family protein n=1 Tax=Yaniella halotolerans TaxID=225453 RepID=UPI0003B36F6B|nr:protein-tyrosine-phosphatase [Yaniella halotolerans]
MICILTLCTGNVCRSPLVAQLLAERLDPAIFRVHSAGTSPLVGDRIPEETQRIATRMGFHDAHDYRARTLTEDMVAASDLILGMSRQHRGAAVKLYPPAVRRAFTLHELAHIVSHISEPELTRCMQHQPGIEAAFMHLVTRMRGVVPRLYPEDLYDAEDPYGRSNRAYERSAKVLTDAVDQVVHFVDRITKVTTVSQIERAQQ